MYDPSRRPHTLRQSSTNPKVALLHSYAGTAAQIVPAIIHKVNSLTQIIRSQHWVSPASNYTYGPFIQWVFCHIPFAMRLHRLQLFLLAEKDFRLFPMTKAAARLRKRHSSQVEHYMRATAPDKYHNILVPDYEIGCKVCEALQRVYADS